MKPTSSGLGMFLSPAQVQESKSTKVQSYVSVISSEPREPYPIESLLRGEYDKSYKSPDYFITECELYSVDEKKSAFSLTASHSARVGANNRAYILEMSGTIDQVKTAAAAGRFSQMIIRAISVDHFRSYLKGNQEGIINNSQFNSSLKM